MSEVLAMKDGRPVIFSKDENDLQRGMAEYAELHGWRVQREVVIPGWGRLDLVLHATDRDDRSIVIEFKNELVKPALIRKAFQQADGYQRWLALNHGYVGRVILSAVTIDVAATNDVAYIYRASVEMSDAGNVMGLISSSRLIHHRAARAREAQGAAIRRARVAIDAHNDVVFHQKPYKKRSVASRLGVNS